MRKGFRLTYSKQEENQIDDNRKGKTSNFKYEHTYKPLKF